MTHSGMSSSHLCVRVFLCICLHDTKTTFHSRTRHSGVSSFQKLCSLEKVARAYLIWCENHASENTLQAKPFDFIMWMQYKLHSGMKLMNKLWNESHSSIISMAFKCHFVKYQFFLLFCSNADLSARRVKHFIRDQIEASSPPFNNIITTAK